MVRRETQGSELSWEEKASSVMKVVLLPGCLKVILALTKGMLVAVIPFLLRASKYSIDCG